jgi:low molecular weight protein-tyrosine phosphatase
VPEPVRVCFVCSGNICRSPTSAVVLTHLAAQAGLADMIEATSAGTGSWHVGEDMDDRSRQVLTDAGYTVPRHVARQFRAADFANHDLVVALDEGHRAALENLAGRTADPSGSRAKVVLLRSYDPKLRPGEQPDVADPYYGGRRGFLDVLEQVERSCGGLLAELAAELPQQTDSPPR